MEKGKNHWEVLTNEEALETAQNFLKKTDWEYQEENPEQLLAQAFQELAKDMLDRLRSHPDELLYGRSNLGDKLEKILSKLKSAQQDVS